jgi:uncharacterized membrane protein YhaH (DUF805 family)
MGFGWAVKRGFAQYAKWGGRASRSEYWWFTLLNAACYIATIALTINVRTPVFVILWVAAVVPAELGVFVRRMHDTGRSGWWWWLGCVPLVGLIVLLTFCCQAGDPDTNDYGPPPVRPSEECDQAGLAA